MDAIRRLTFGIKGYMEFTASGFLANQKKFNQADTDVSLKDEFVMITGANSGIGKQAAIDIAQKGAKVYMVCRNRERGEAALNEVIETSKNSNVELLLCDLSSPKDVLKLTNEFVVGKKPLTILCANAGVLLNDYELIDDKYEATFATNTLSIHMLVRELAPILIETNDPKCIITTSGGALPAKLNLNESLTKPNKFDGVQAYAQTKRQEIELAEYYAKEYPKIFFATWHPGWTDTPGVEKSLPSFYQKMKGKLRSVEQGTDTMVWLSCLKEPSKKFNNGALFFDRAEVTKHLMWGGTQATPEALNEFVKKLDEFFKQEKAALNTN